MLPLMNCRKAKVPKISGTSRMPWSVAPCAAANTKRVTNRTPTLDIRHNIPEATIAPPW